MCDNKLLHKSLLHLSFVDAPGRGVTVQLPGHAYGVAALADLHDTWVADALAGLQAGVFVRCRVLGLAAPRGGGGAAPPADAKAAAKAADASGSRAPLHEKQDMPAGLDENL